MPATPAAARRRQFAIQRAGRAAGQHGELVERIVDLGTERDELARVFSTCVVIRSTSTSAAGRVRGAARSASACALEVGGACAIVRRSLLVAQVDIRLRDFGRELHLRVGEIGLHGIRFGRRRLDRAPRAAEEIDFPASVETRDVKANRSAAVEEDSSAPSEPTAEIRSGERVRSAAAAPEPSAARCSLPAARRARARARAPARLADRDLLERGVDQRRSVAGR